MSVLSTIAAFGFDDFDPPRVLSLYRQMGCTHAQYYRNENNPPATDRVLETCREAGLTLESIHGVFSNAYDPSSTDETKRRFSVETYRDEGELALSLDAPAVVVHPAPMDAGPDPLPRDEYDRRIEALSQSMDELARMGEQLGVTYLIENMPNESHIGRDTDELARMIRRVGSPRLRMCFDLGHAQVTGGVTDRLQRSADVVDYLHVHDNDGRHDSHWMPGDGIMDWPEVGRTVERLRLSAPVMLEVFYFRERLARYAESDLPLRLPRWLGIPAAQP